MKTLLKFAGLITIAFSLCSSAQQSAPGTPGATSPAPSSAATTQTEQPVPSSAPAVQDDPAQSAGSSGTSVDQDTPSRFSPLQSLVAGSSDLLGRSYILSNLDFADRYESATADSVYTVSGSFNLQRQGRKNQTSIAYTGGADVHSKQSGMDSSFHRLVIAQTFYSKRWTVSLVDQFNYLPESPYGSSAFGGMSSALLDMLSRLFPDQSFIDPGARRYANAGIVYGERKLSARSNLHGTLAYSFLEFPKSGYVSYRSYSANTGYTHQLGRGSLNFDYNGSLTHFGKSSKMQAHQLEISYHRPIGRALSLEIGAGPDSVLFNDVKRKLTDTRILVDGRFGLNWSGRRTSAHVSYSHGAGGGGGLLQGAETHSVNLGLTRRLGRVWTAGWSAGYSRNSHIATAMAPSQQPSSYDAVFTGVSLQRPIGRSFSTFLNYDFQYQMTDGQAAQSIFRRHSVRAGFTFNLRPIAIH